MSQSAMLAVLGAALFFWLVVALLWSPDDWVERIERLEEPARRAGMGLAHACCWTP